MSPTITADELTENDLEAGAAVVYNNQSGFGPDELTTYIHDRDGGELLVSANEDGGPYDYIDVADVMDDDSIIRVKVGD